MRIGAEIAMSMNADKIVTPILQNASDTEYLIYLPLYRSLADLGRPIELYLYPNELHVRNQPRHRLEIYDRNLDWFRFWLEGEQDPDPTKTEQYKRWNHLARRSESTLGELLCASDRSVHQRRSEKLSGVPGEPSTPGARPTPRQHTPWQFPDAGSKYPRRAPA